MKKVMKDIFQRLMFNILKNYMKFIMKYYQNEPKFNGVYSRNNLSKIKDGAYIINLDEYEFLETHLITLYVNAKNVTYFDSFGVEHIPKEIRKLIGNKTIITNIFRIQHMIQ